MVQGPAAWLQLGPWGNTMRATAQKQGHLTPPWPASLPHPPLLPSGVEFVLKTFDGQWLSWEQGHHTSNFYTDLPLRT